MEFVRFSGLEPAQTKMFEQWAQVFIDAAVADNGEHDERSATDLRQMERNPSVERRLMAVVEEGRVAAGASVMFPLQDNLTHSFGMLSVLPSHRRRGIGTRLLEWVEDSARERGRSTLQMHFTTRPGTRAAGHVLAERHGFDLAQRLLRSDLDVTKAVSRAAGDVEPRGYRLERFTGLPSQWEEAYARFQVQMTEDAPLGDLALEPEVWDVDRVRGQSERTAAMGRTRWFTMAVDEGSGEAAGFTEIQWSTDMGDRAYQQDTLVTREHRGHELGRALKMANVLALHRDRPEIRTVRTWNADDNTHMLAVNAELGCAVGSEMLEWQKRLR